jgi:predicted naringenin-chalcone synthase
LLSCWLQLSIEDKCSIVGGNLCADGVRALVYGAQQMASFNKTMSLRDAHTALAPFSRVSQPALHSVPTRAQIIMSTLRYII